ncbi:MAG: peptide deformylase [Bacteroidota bacterium]
MAVKRIRLLGDPLLRTHCTRVRFPLGKAEQRLITDLRDTLHDFRTRRGFGRGIAAPQIGVTKRIIYIHSIGALINPRIVVRSRATFTLWDDCFSFPDLLVKVRRHKKIEVEFYDEENVRRTLVAKDDLAELLQHEIDHLNGVLAIDRALNLASIILRDEYRRCVKKI